LPKQFRTDESIAPRKEETKNDSRKPHILNLNENHDFTKQSVDDFFIITELVKLFRQARKRQNKSRFMRNAEPRVSIAMKMVQWFGRISTK
jgi:hypothetical protein